MEEVCDASPTCSAPPASTASRPEQACPVCRKERLTLVSWVFGDALRHAAGSARRPDELERLAALHADFSVYVVEVCNSCRWNHLVLSYVMGSGGDPDTGTGRARERRRTVAE